MVAFTDEHKAERTTNYFEEGVHQVKIESVDFGVTDDNKEYAEFNVVDPDDAEKKASCRVWFTTDAAIGYSFNVFKQIFVHNSTGEKAKEAMRKQIDTITNTDELAKVAETLKGKDCWYSTYKNLERPYQKTDGTTAYSYDRNVYGYEPKPRAVSSESQVMDSMGGGEVMTPVDNADDEPFPFKG